LSRVVVVADSSALIALATCRALELLPRLYDEVKAPRRVYDEVTVADRPQAELLATFLAGRVVEVDLSRFVLAAAGLGQGELEAMALYKDMAADLLLVDDRRARAFAEANDIRCIGALGVLLAAKHEKQVDRLKPYIDVLRDSPLHFDEPLLIRVLQLAGE